MAAKVKALQQWCKLQCEGYDGVEINNMTSSWRDGLAFCAIIHRYHPELIDFDSLNKKNVFENNQLAFDVGEKLGICPLLDACDMESMRVPDRLSILTYVSQFYRVFKDKKAHAKSPLKRPASPTPQTMGDQKFSTQGPKRNKQQQENTQPKDTMDTGVKNNYNESNKSGYMAGDEVSSEDDTCSICKEKVYLMERHRKNNLLYHRKCYRESEQLDMQKFCNESNDLFESTPKYLKNDSVSIFRIKSSEDKENSRNFQQHDSTYRSDTRSTRYTTRPIPTLSDASVSLSSASSNTLTPTVVQNLRPIVHSKVFQSPTNHLTSISDSILEIAKSQHNFSSYDIIKEEMVRSDMDEEISIVSIPSTSDFGSVSQKNSFMQERNITNSAITDHKTFNMLRSLRARNKTRDNHSNPFDVAEAKRLTSTVGQTSPSLTSVSSLDLNKSSKENLPSKQSVVPLTASLTSVSDISNSPAPPYDSDSKKALGQSMMNAVIWLDDFSEKSKEPAVCQSCRQNLCSSQCLMKENKTKVTTSLDSLEHTTACIKNAKSEEYTNIVLLPQLKVSDEFNSINELYDTDRSKIEERSLKKVVAVDIIPPEKKKLEEKKEYNLTDHLNLASVKPRVERSYPTTYRSDDAKKNRSPVSNFDSSTVNKWMKTLNSDPGENSKKYLDFSKKLNNDISELEDEIKRRKKLSECIRDKLKEESEEKIDKRSYSKNAENNRRSRNESPKSKHVHSKVKDNIKLFSSGTVQKSTSKSSGSNPTKTDPIPVPRRSVSKNNTTEPAVTLVDIMHQVSTSKKPLQKKETESKSFSLLFSKHSNDSVKIFGDNKIRTQIHPPKQHSEEIAPSKSPLGEDPKCVKTEILKNNEPETNVKAFKITDKTEGEKRGSRVQSQTTTAKVHNAWEFQFKLYDDEKDKPKAVDYSQKKVDSKFVETKETKDVGTSVAFEEKFPPKYTSVAKCDVPRSPSEARNEVFKKTSVEKNDASKSTSVEKNLGVESGKKSPEPPPIKDAAPRDDKNKPQEDIKCSANKEAEKPTEKKSEVLPGTKLMTCKSITTQTSQALLPPVRVVSSSAKGPPRPPPPSLHTGTKSNQTSFDSIAEHKARNDKKQVYNKLKSSEKIETKPKKYPEEPENKESVITQNLISSDTACATLKQKKTKVSGGSHSSFFQKLSLPKFHRKVVKPKSTFYKSFDNESPNFEERVNRENDRRTSDFESQKKVLVKLKNEFSMPGKESPRDQNVQNVSLELKEEVNMTQVLDKQLKELLSSDSQKVLMEKNLDGVSALIITSHQDKTHTTQKHTEKMADELSLHRCANQSTKSIDFDITSSPLKSSQCTLEDVSHIRPSLTFFNIQNPKQEPHKNPSENLKPPRPAAVSPELLSIKSDKTITDGRKKIIPSSDPSLKTLNSTDSEPPDESYVVPDFISDPYLYEKAKMSLISKLAEVDKLLKNLEAEGRDLEESIREKGDDEEKMVRWFELIEQRNVLLRDETEFIYRYRQLEYERDQVLVDQELRTLMLIDDSRKKLWDREREERLLSRKIELVSLRDKIVENQETDRLRYLKEDKVLNKNKRHALKKKKKK